MRCIVLSSQAVSWSLLVTVLLLTLAATVAQLALAQMTHCISLLVLVHQVPPQTHRLCTLCLPQNIYNLLTLATSLATRAKLRLQPCSGSSTGLGNTFGWRRMEVVLSIYLLPPNILLLGCRLPGFASILVFAMFCYLCRSSAGGLTLIASSPYLL